jgi:hypothetical protein
MTDITTICNQRLKQMLFTTPPQRFNPISPYPQYTQAELNMRRKAEILSHGAAKSNTKTNNYTKAEKYKLFVSGVNQASTYPSTTKTTASVQFIAGNLFFGTSDVSLTTFHQTVITATAKTCPNLDMVPTPTSSSNVPGPIQYLYRDLRVPLYNYATNQRSYSQEPISDTGMWSTIINQNQPCYNGISTPIFSFGILNTIDKPSYQYTYTTPVALTYSATVTTSTSLPIDISNITLSVANTNAVVFYSDKQVQYVSPVCHFENSSMIFDISLVPQPGTTSYSASITNYMGGLSIQGLNLFTSPGYVYDIQLNCVMNITNNNSLTGKYIISNEKYGVICNYRGGNNLVANNCTIRSSPITTLTSFSFSGL